MLIDPGRVASKITTFTIQTIVELWQPGSLVDVKPALSAIMSTLHHPFNYSKDNMIQGLMVAEVMNWCTLKAEESPENYVQFLASLDRPHMAAKQGEEAEQIAHSHVSAFTAAYANPGKIGGTTAHDLTTIGVQGPRAPFVEKISANIEKALDAGAVKGMSVKDLPVIKQIMEATPDSETPNPIDQAITRLPGLSVLTIFDGIDMGEIVSAPGVGLILKDGVIAMRLRDTDMVKREQLAAQQKLGRLEDRPTSEILDLLDFGARKHEEKKMDEAQRPTEESKTRRLMNKLKLGSGSN